MAPWGTGGNLKEPRISASIYRRSLWGQGDSLPSILTSREIAGLLHHPRKSFENLVADAA